MSESLARRLRRAEGTLAARGSAAERRASAAYQRVLRGTAEWSDHEILGEPWLASWRAEVISLLPMAVVQEHVARPWPRWQSVLAPVMSILTVPPGTPLDGAKQLAAKEIGFSWRTGAGSLERVRGTSHRLVIGGGDGQPMRQICWTVENGTPRLADAVLAAAHNVHLDHQKIYSFVAHRNFMELADSVLGPAHGREFAGHEERLARRSNYVYLDVSLLEAAVLFSAWADFDWLGPGGRRWMSGQIRSFSVSTEDNRDGFRRRLIDAVVQRALQRLRAERDQPRPWLTESWYARQKAASAGWEIEQEFLLAQSRGEPLTMKEVEALISEQRAGPRAT